MCQFTLPGMSMDSGAKVGRQYLLPIKSGLVAIILISISLICSNNNIYYIRMTISNHYWLTKLVLKETYLPFFLCLLFRIMAYLGNLTEMVGDKLIFVVYRMVQIVINFLTGQINRQPLFN